MAAAQQRGNAGQVSAPRVEPPRSFHGSGALTSWRTLYLAHPRLMPTVYVPGPVVTARKV
jgi:hypothetical protein